MTKRLTIKDVKMNQANIKKLEHVIETNKNSLVEFNITNCYLTDPGELNRV